MQVQNIHLSGPITQYNSFEYTGQMPDIETLSERALNAYNKLLDNRVSYEILSIEEIEFKHLIQCHVHWSNRPWLYGQDLMKLGECIMIEIDTKILQMNVWFEDFDIVARLISEEIGEYESFKLGSLPHWTANISDGKRHRMNFVLARIPNKNSPYRGVVEEEENHSKLLVGAALNCTVEVWVRPWLNNSRLIKVERCDEYEHYLMDKIYMKKPVKKANINLSESLRRRLPGQHSIWQKHLVNNSLSSYMAFMNE
ncbi:unnamed protein product, partial [Trichobilharzia regenti]